MLNLNSLCERDSERIIDLTLEAKLVLFAKKCAQINFFHCQPGGAGTEKKDRSSEQLSEKQQAKASKLLLAPKQSNAS